MAGGGIALDWEWSLASGAKVKATLDVDTNQESVWLDRRLVSRAVAGSKPEGHVISFGPSTPYRSEEVRVIFYPNHTCRLLVGGKTVQATPAAEDHSNNNNNAPPIGGYPQFSAPKQSRPLRTFVILGSLFALLLITSVIATKRKIEATKNVPLTESLAATNGLFIAHYPTHYEATIEKSSDPKDIESKVTQIRIAPRQGGYPYVYLQALPHPVSSDPELLGRFIMKLNIWSWQKQNVTFTEKRHASSAPCFGTTGPGQSPESGFVIEGVLRTPTGEARRWSCTFVHGGHGYHVASYFEDSSSTQEALMRRIIDGTELTGEPEALEPGIQRHGGGGLVWPIGAAPMDLYQSPP